MKIFTNAALFATITVIGLFTTACPPHKSIADIQANPGRYQDKEVVVVGVVRDSYGISIPGTRMGGGAYQIDDGTGSIWVVVSDNSVPQKGARVGIKGVMSSGVSWKGRNYGLGLYEEKRRYAKR